MWWKQARDKQKLARAEDAVTTAAERIGLCTKYALFIFVKV